MANRNEKTNVPTEKKATHTQERAAKSPRQTSRLYQLFIFLILIASLALAVYAVITSFNAKQTAEQEVIHYRDIFSALNKNHAEALSSLQNQTDLVHKISQKNQETLKALREKFHTLSEQSLYQSDTWRLFKARYYLELAQINAHWRHESDSTLALLNQANHLLINFHNPSIYAIREAIAGEIAQLNAQKQVDMPGILSQLNALQRQIATLKIATGPSTMTPSQEAFQPNHDAASKAVWRKKLQNSIHLLEKLVVVRHQDDKRYPFLDPDQLTLVRANIELQLQQAQWAVLHHDQKIYELSIKQARDSIQRAFQSNQAATEGLLKQLKQLQQTNISPQKPKIEESLQLLNHYIRTQASQQLNKSNSQGASS